MIKVLIADDQELIRESLKIVLGANEDMEVTGIAENGEEVLSQIKKEKPDVILMDIRMPGIDGVECTLSLIHIYFGRIEYNRSTYLFDEV